MWSTPVRYNIPSLFSYEEEPGSPDITPPEVGILINADNLQYDGDLLNFRLLLTYCFSRDFVNAFERLFWAMVVSLENADTGQSVVLNVSEEGRKRYSQIVYPNFKGFPDQEITATTFETGWVGLDLEIPVRRPLFHPSFFVTASLQTYISNTIGFDLKEEKIYTYRDGSPFDVELADFSEDE